MGTALLVGILVLAAVGVAIAVVCGVFFRNRSSKRTLQKNTRANAAAARGGGGGDAVVVHNASWESGATVYGIPMDTATESGVAKRHVAFQGTTDNAFLQS